MDANRAWNRPESISGNMQAEHVTRPNLHQVSDSGRQAERESRRGQGMGRPDGEQVRAAANQRAEAVARTKGHHGQEGKNPKGIEKGVGFTVRDGIAFAQASLRRSEIPGVLRALDDPSDLSPWRGR